VTHSDRPTFFIDWCLGKSVANALSKAGAQVEQHSDHFAPEAPDVEWLPVVTEQDWVVLTKDENIGREPREVEAIARAGARVFILVSGNLTRQQMADLFVEVLPKLEKFNQGNQPPFIAKIYKDGRVELWRKRTNLLKLLKSDDPTPADETMLE
jgi:predicted nuclease of predicted toxin-antitoxin system